METDPSFLEKLVYGDNAPSTNFVWHNHPFPFKAAKRLRQLTWHGTDVESVRQALPKCPNVTSMKFVLTGYAEPWTIDRLQAMPTFTTLRQMEMGTLEVGNDIRWSCFLLPFARFSRQVASLH